MSSNNQKKVLILSALPFDQSSTTRAFKTYFLGLKKENLAQIYTNTSFPSFAFCDNFYQITDFRLLKSVVIKKINAGIPINSCTASEVLTDPKKGNFLFRIGKLGWPIFHLFRLCLWTKKRWLTKELYRWILDFKPTILFFHNSDSPFLAKMAIQISNDFNLPLVLEISDDYYFNYHFSISPLYYFYRLIFKSTFRFLLKKSSNRIFVSDKMKTKYCSFFHSFGKVIYISSEIKRDNEPKGSLDISYFGNVGLGRLKSLIKIGKVLSEIDPSLHINVYSPKVGSRDNAIKNRNFPGLCFFPSVDYKEVQRIMISSRLLVIAEGFERRNIIDTKFSLSTKTADSLSTGVPVFAYGPVGNGTIDFLLDHGLSLVATSTKCIKKLLSDALFDEKQREVAVKKQNEISSLYFQIDKNFRKFAQMIDEASL